MRRALCFLLTAIAALQAASAAAQELKLEKPSVLKTAQDLVSLDRKVQKTLLLHQLTAPEAPDAITTFAADVESIDVSALPADVQEAHRKFVDVLKAHAKAIEEPGGIAEQLREKRNDQKALVLVLTKLTTLNRLIPKALKEVEGAAAKHGSPSPSGKSGGE